MDAQIFGKSASGHLVKTVLSEEEYAFVPDDLPPRWEWPEPMWPLLMEARNTLATLEGIGKHLPNPSGREG